MVDAYLHEGKLDEATYREQLARLGSDMNEARAQQLTSSVETVHLDRALDFAPKLLTNPAGFWETLLPERRPVLQRAIYPDGMRYREGTFETAEISLVFSYFRSFDTADSQMASLAPGSWNHSRDWLEEMESLRQSLSNAPGSAPEARISPAGARRSGTPFSAWSQ